MLLQAVAASVVFAENYGALPNDSCDLPEPIMKTLCIAAAGAGVAVAGGAACAAAFRALPRRRRALLVTAAALVALALGASLRFMLDSDVGPAPCSQGELDRAQQLFGVTATMAAATTFLAAVCAFQASIAAVGRPALRLAVLIAAALPLWACAWWMYEVLSSSG